MTILAIQYHSHDTGVALIKDGKILYASSNERFSRIKMDSNVPLLALRDCLRFCKITPKEIDQVVFVGEPFPNSLIEFIQFYGTPIIQTKGKFLFSFLKSPKLLRNVISSLAVPSYILKEVYPKVMLRRELKGFNGKYSFVPHHHSHLYSAYFASGWKKCLVGCIEGSGLTRSLSFYLVDHNNWQKITECSLPHSAGIFYGLVTQLLGFKPLRHEGKITGLSAFGNPKKAYKIVKKLLWVEGLKIKLDYNKCLDLSISYLKNNTLPEVFKNFSKEDIAASFQHRLESCIVEIIEQIVSQYKVSNIALAGGVVANVKLNQRIHEIKEVNEIFIFPAMGDDGLALGAALYQGSKNGMKFNALSNVYFGPDFSEKEIFKTIKKNKIRSEYRKNIEKDIASLLSKGFIVARFNGRMEYGPRALGNRSILSQATDPNINQTLNEKLRRTEFMPFAPTTLIEYSKKCFKNLDGATLPAKFMTITFDCTNFMKKKCPAVVHVDGTARPQTLGRPENPSYYKILNEYYKITGIPAIINTSFNIHEEPIVCTPDDAIRAFLSSKLDYLALGNYLLKRDE